MELLKSLLLEGEEYKWWVESADAINGLKSVMGPMIGIIAVMGIVYTVVLWVNWIKADGGKRAECLTRIKNAIIGFVITLVVMSLFYILLDNIEPIATWIDGIVGDGQGFSDGATGGGTSGGGGSSGGGGIRPGGGNNTVPEIK